MGDDPLVAQSARTLLALALATTLTLTLTLIRSHSQLALIKRCEALQIEVYDWDMLGADDFIGSARLVLPLLDMPIELDLNPITLLGRKGKAAGRLEGVVALCTQDPTNVATSSATFEMGEQ